MRWWYNESLAAWYCYYVRFYKYKGVERRVGLHSHIIIYYLLYLNSPTLHIYICIVNIKCIHLWKKYIILLTIGFFVFFKTRISKQKSCCSRWSCFFFSVYCIFSVLFHVRTTSKVNGESVALRPPLKWPSGHSSDRLRVRHSSDHSSCRTLVICFSLFALGYTIAVFDPTLLSRHG